VDVDELVTKFLESEDKNFSLFNYVNELNNEIEQVTRFPFGCLSLLCSLGVNAEVSDLLPVVAVR
jgi:hypothetical protein